MDDCASTRGNYIIKDGHVVKSWGSQAEAGGWWDTRTGYREKASSIHPSILGLKKPESMKDSQALNIARDSL